MGFLKRFFSLDKKNKNGGLPPEHNPQHLRRYHTAQSLLLVSEDVEATASRLLRSASARWAMVSEPDFSPLPPLTHPIDNVGNIPTISSTRTPTVQSRGTYVVKVYERTLHSCTEFPNANPGLQTPPPRSRSVQMPDNYEGSDDEDEMTPPRTKHASITPRDQTRLHRLRQDPSIASLLTLYDVHGRLDSDVFSNTPSHLGEGRPQKQRTGSTMRQLLGNPPSEAQPGTSCNEGDISWAERLLGECSVISPSLASSASSTSSLGLRTPIEPPYIHDHFHYNVSHERHVTIISEEESSLNRSHYPLISSMEVELGSNATASHINPSIMTSSYLYDNLETPQRASQIFQFLTEKRKPRDKRNLSDLPVSISPDLTCSEESLSLPFFPESPSNQTCPDPQQQLRGTRDLGFTSRIPRFSQKRPESRPTEAENAINIVATCVSRTRSPCAPKAVEASSGDSEPEDTRSVDTGHRDYAFITALSRAHVQKLPCDEANMAFIMSPVQEKARAPGDNKPKRLSSIRRKPVPQLYDKENSWNTHPIPTTPSRSRSVLTTDTNVAPSPASSTEMSPVGQQIMANVRKQRYGSVSS